MKRNRHGLSKLLEAIDGFKYIFADTTWFKVKIDDEISLDTA